MKASGPEHEIVDKLLVDQLVGLGWAYIEGDVHVPYLPRFRRICRGWIRSKTVPQTVP